jgi:hypothetical protein
MRGVPAFKRVYNSQGGGGGTSSIAAMSIRGIQAVRSFSSVDADAFMEFLEEDVLGHVTNRFPLPKSVLLLDNATVHEKRRIRDACDQHGVIAVFLPPYSYDFQPIEKAFHMAKMYIRDKWPEAEANEPVKVRLEEALWSLNDPRKTMNLFSSCFFEISEEDIAYAME